MSTEWRQVGKVKKLCIYPLKSGRRIEVNQAECTKQGFMEVEKPEKSFQLRDRSFVVYDESSLEYRSAKHYPKLVLIQVKSNNVNSIELSAPGVKNFVLTVPRNKKEHIEVSVRQLGEEIPLVDCGDEVAAWVCGYLLGDKTGLRLGYNDGTNRRNTGAFQNLIDYNNRGLTSDSMGLSSNKCAVLLNSAASVRDIKEKTGISEITEDNFRPSIVVDDENLTPFEEDKWTFIKIGDVVLKNVLDCTRCILTTVNMEKGERRADREPLKSMEKYRLSKGPHKTPIMGIYLEVIQTGKVSLEDNVYVGKN